MIFPIPPAEDMLVLSSDPEVLYALERLDLLTSFWQTRESIRRRVPSGPILWAIENNSSTGWALFVGIEGFERDNGYLGVLGLPTPQGQVAFRRLRQQLRASLKRLHGEFSWTVN